MKCWFRCVIFCLIPLLCITADWPVPKAIKCNSTGTFHCKKTGKYEDPFDSTCSKYFLCNEFEYEAVEVELICPEKTFYDPVNELCSAHYKCICDETTNFTTSVPTTTSSTLKTKTPMPYPNECEICSQCITSVSTKTTIGSTIWTTYPSTTTTSYATVTKDTSITGEFTNTTTVEPSASETTTSSNTPEHSSSSASQSSFFTKASQTAETALTTPKHCALGGNFTCTETGRFVNPNDPSCNSYFYCYVWSNSTIGQYLYSCSIGLFNPSKGACDISYVCPCSEATTIFENSTVSTTRQQPSSTSSQSSSSTQASSTVESTTVSSTTPKHCALGGNFTCTETGRFLNPNDPSCNSYFYCYVWSNSTIGQYLYSCSIGLFNPSKGACDISYVCPCSEATTVFENSTVSTTRQQPSSTSSQSSSSTQASSTAESTMVSSTTPKHCALGGNFTCTETGRFLNPNDPSCNSYFYCYVWSNSTIGQCLYSCSIGLFNPSKGACDISYVCPCSEATTIFENSTVSTTRQQPSSTSSQSSSSTQASSTAESTTVSSTTPKHCALGGNFTCTETGRFANPNDPSCNSYFYCYVWSSGRVGQYVYSCSVGLFNPGKGACDVSYVCPCTVTYRSYSSANVKSAPSSKNTANTFFWGTSSFYSSIKSNKTLTLKG